MANIQAYSITILAIIQGILCGTDSFLLYIDTSQGRFLSIFFKSLKASWMVDLFTLKRLAKAELDQFVLPITTYLLSTIMSLS